MDTETGIDTATRAAQEFLEALGVATDSPGLRDSPARMARAYAEMLTPRAFELTTFPNDEKYDELVVVKAIPVQSLCEHHLLPFTGVAHVGYLPGGCIAGLSKLARAVQQCAARPQVQERLTEEIADAIAAHLAPQGVGVVVAARHECMELRGARAVGATTLTSALRDNPGSRAEFLDLIRRA